MTQSGTEAAAANVDRDVSTLVVGIIGGTGDQGRGLATRWSGAGQQVIIGSRTAERASEIAAAIAAERRPPAVPRGMDNSSCAAAADVVVLAVPFEGHAETVESLSGVLAGKIVVDCVNPLGFDKQGAFALPVPDGSAAEQAARLLPESRVTAAFHHVSAVTLLDPAIASVDTDVLVLGDDREATDVVAALATVIPGVRGIYGGRLRNAGQVEAFTANLISVNRRYKAHAGIRVTDVD